MTLMVWSLTGRYVTFQSHSIIMHLSFFSTTMLCYQALRVLLLEFQKKEFKSKIPIVIAPDCITSGTDTCQHWIISSDWVMTGLKPRKETPTYHVKIKTTTDYKASKQTSRWTIHTKPRQGNNLYKNLLLILQSNTNHPSA